MNNKIGMITEQGDLGLGFTPITEEDLKKIKKNLDKIRKKKEEEDSEEDK